MSKYQGISTLEVLEGAENYNQWIAKTIHKRIGSPALEIGAGTGNITKYLTGIKSLYVTDIDSSLVVGLKKKFVSHKNMTCLRLDIEKSIPKKFIGYFSAIFAVNVLEHIKDDNKALKNIRSLLKKNGSISLLVPAKMFAYTRLDKELGHYRRYEKAELREKFEDTGFVVDEIFYFNIVGLISWIVRDKTEKNNIHMQPYQIAIFDKIVPFLELIEGVIRPFVGISLIICGRKK